MKLVSSLPKSGSRVSKNCSGKTEKERLVPVRVVGDGSQEFKFNVIFRKNPGQAQI